ncbi:MAG: hypothetical protein ACK5P5_04515 [Pseudobdellovibrionaceae bacterium]
MKFFKKIFGGFDSIPHENKTKPFYKNLNSDERRDWFIRTRPWNQMSLKFINALIDIFTDSPKFELFVVYSMELG